MRDNGSPAPTFEFDDDHSYFSVTLPVHPALAMDDTGTRHAGGATEQVTEQVASLLHRLGQRPEPVAASDLMAALGLRHRPTFLYNYLTPALEVGLIARTIPDKPRSRNQRYRLTPAGKAWLTRHAEPPTQHATPNGSDEE